MEKRETVRLNIDHTEYVTRVSARYAGRKPYAPPVPGRVCSFIPGTVVEVLVKEGDQVAEGDDLIIIDAMKMKNRLKCHTAGTVLTVNVSPGDRVPKGLILVEIG